MYNGIVFPDLDPVAFQIGFFAVRWYSLAYIVGLLLAWFLLRLMSKKTHSAFTVLKIDDFLVWAIAGIIIGGRLGYVLFYQLPYYLEYPMHILALWEGGMSFHGGLLGMIIATILFAKKKDINMFMVADMLAVVAPIGLFLGRLANFVNGELYGRVTHAVPWAVIFPTGGEEPRHPSQLYEAGLEGVLLFIILNIVWWKIPKYRERYGLTAGLFFILYGIGRFALEVFREPDAHLGFLAAHLTMGQWLCVPMVVFGFWLVYRSSPRTRFKRALEKKDHV